MTIKDIARIAGVTHSTVSRCLNDSPLVAEATRERIKAIAREYGYSPNAYAQRLVTKRSHTLGLFFLSREELNFMENFAVQFLSGITSACWAASYDLLLFTTPRDTVNVTSYLQMCRARHVEGVLFLGMTSDDPHLPEIQSSPIPAAIIDFDAAGENVAFVGSDNDMGVRLAMEYLCERGHGRIAFIGGPTVSPVAMVRESCYRRELARLRPELEPFVFRGNFSRESGYARAMDIMREPLLPTAVFAANDAMALGAIKAFREHGLRVPADISVMGYDDAAAAQYAEPGLTTVAQNAELIGRQAVSYVIDRINGHERERIIRIEPQLVQRESVRRLIDGYAFGESKENP